MKLAKILKEEILNQTQEYVGQCDVIRKKPGGEEFWHELMDNREEISKDDFLLNINPSRVVEDDETVDDFIAGDLDSYFAKTVINNKLYYFIGTHGFEFIWLKK